MTDGGTNRNPSGESLALLVRASDYLCAIPIGSVSEIMRPLEIGAITGVPDFVLGLSLIRGHPTPVVSLPALLEGSRMMGEETRFVTLRLDQRSVALSVSEVKGVLDLAAAALGELPPLLQKSRYDIVAAVGALDKELLLVLETGRILPEEIWEALQKQEAKG